jgi:hypothetical protein
MTTMQLVSLGLLAGVVLWVYVLPAIPKTKSSLMAEVSAIVRIRQTHPGSKVEKACNDLLSALLEVS